MRLSESARYIIRKATEEIFGSSAIVRLFGSRLDDTVKGGDIDLLVELPAVDADKWTKLSKFSLRLQKELGEQAIDILVIDPSTVLQAIHKQALKTGMPLLPLAPSTQHNITTTMNEYRIDPLERLLYTLDIVAREGSQLIYSHQCLFSVPIDRDWFASLTVDQDKAIYLEAFVSRYNRMQDTIGEKLLPRWLIALDELVEHRGQIDMLNRAERLGVIDSVEDWRDARKSRNLLIHEYIIDLAVFADELMKAKRYTLMLIDTYNRMRAYLIKQLNLSIDRLPPELLIQTVL